MTLSQAATKSRVVSSPSSLATLLADPPIIVGQHFIWVGNARFVKTFGAKFQGIRGNIFRYVMPILFVLDLRHLNRLEIVQQFVTFGVFINEIAQRIDPA